MNLGSMFYVYEFQLLIGKFSSCWLSTSPHLEGTVPPSSACRHLSEKAEVQDNPATSYKKRLGRELALGEGKVIECEFAGDSLTCSLSEQNLQGSACELRAVGREGAGDFFCAGCYVLGHHTQINLSITQLPSEARLFVLALTPSLHKSSHVLWSWFG